MAKAERVTVTLAAALIQGIDRCDRNRSRFIADVGGHQEADPFDPADLRLAATALTS